MAKTKKKTKSRTQLKSRNLSSKTKATTKTRAKSKVDAKPKAKAKAKPRAKSKKPKRAPSFFKCKTCLGYFDIPEREVHVCEPPTEEAAFSIVESEEAREAWDKLRRFASELGEQRIYASAKSVMFAKSVCYMFVRPKKTKLEVCLFLPTMLKHPLVKATREDSHRKTAHMIMLEHEDQVEEPLTDWIREAFEHIK